MDNISTPLVTAVITTYKRPVEILKRALLSILRQTYKNIEVFIVNDYPEDLTLVNEIAEMIKKTGEHNIKYIVLDKNRGACKARNVALKNAKGKYIAFLDDDDEWLDEKIELQVKSAEKTNVDIVYCNSINYYMNINKEKERFKYEQDSGRIFYKILSSNLIGSCSFPLFRTKTLREVNGFREDMPALQDWELYLRITKKGVVSYIHQPLIRYYFYEGERISTNLRNRVIAYEKIRKEFLKELNDNPKVASSFYFMGSNFYSLSNNLKKANYYYWKGLKNDPLKIKRNVILLVKMIVRRFIKPKAM